MTATRADRPKLLDLFCGQCGAGWGYELAGFSVTGVDIRPMELIPPDIEFVHADAITYLREHGHEYDAIHASPVCRAHTVARNSAPVRYQHEDHIPALREALTDLWRRGHHVPYVIENVPGAPLVDPVELCGAMFGLPLYRHRLFEFGGVVKPVPPPHPQHVHKVAPMGRRPGPGEFWSIAGNFSGVEAAAEAMGMPWANQDGVRQAIPPAYAYWVGVHLMHQHRFRRCRKTAKVAA